MMALTHMVVSAAATSLVLGTTNPVLIGVGTLAGLLPDIDISTSVAGRVFPWVSHWLERRFPHRSCTHSFAATILVAVVVYGANFLTGGKSLDLPDAITCGYFFGWFIDMFTKSGVEMFWPSRDRYVCPGNRKFRIKSGSSAEHVLLGVAICAAFFIFNINASGGVMNNLNRLMATPMGVQQVYNQSGSTNIIVAHVKGVRSRDRSPVNGDFKIIEAKGQDFIVQSLSGKIYKIGTDAEAQIIAEQITADVSARAITQITPLVLDDEDILSALGKYKLAAPTIFLSGQLNIDEPEDVHYIHDPYQFPFIKLSGKSLTLDIAPLPTVLEYFQNQDATGELELKIINEATTTTNSQTTIKSRKSC